jgi:hypothetical protein
MRIPRRFCLYLYLMGLALAVGVCAHARAQAALLMEDADGFSRSLDPTGHEAIYFARICAASPAQLRRCTPGESGVVISRYKGIAGYDWLAVPLIPYLYSVDQAFAVPARVDQATVDKMRGRYHETHLMSLGEDVPQGGRIQRGWNQLVGAAYERRIYAFRFETTEAQDDAFIAWMNDAANRSHFNILFGNCSNFADQVLNFYFPHTFRRRILPDGGIVTPRQVAYELVRYARRHPEIDLTVLEIPQVPGYRRPSRPGESVAESLTVSGYVLPIAALNPIVAAGLVGDYLVWGRYPLPLKQAQIVSPEDMAPLKNSTSTAQSPPQPLEPDGVLSYKGSGLNPPDIQ